MTMVALAAAVVVTTTTELIQVTHVEYHYGSRQGIIQYCDYIDQQWNCSFNIACIAWPLVFFGSLA